MMKAISRGPLASGNHVSYKSFVESVVGTNPLGTRKIKEGIFSSSDLEMDGRHQLDY